MDQPIDFTSIIMAVGALGAASAAIVEAIKFDRVKNIGFRKITRIVTHDVLATLGNVYGEAYLDYLKSLYREDRRGGKLKSLLRQGFRIALTPQTSATFAGILPTLNAARLAAAAQTIADGELPSQENAIALGQFEAALDARLEAALASADQHYGWAMRGLAMLTSVGLSVAVAASGIAPNDPKPSIGLAIIIGFAAVPLAPIAKDLVSAVSAARKAFELR